MSTKSNPDSNLAVICHEFAKEWGFYEDGKDKEFFTFRQLAHLAAEVGELSNAYRKTGSIDPEEVADIVIVLADLCGLHEIDLESAVWAKIHKNHSRGKRYGLVSK